MAFQQYNVYDGLTSCRVVATGNQAGTYYNGQLNNGVGATLTYTATGAITIDSVVLQNGDSVALVGQTNAWENGIYVVSNEAGTGLNGILQRRQDMQCIEQLRAGQWCSIGAGTVSAGSMFVVVEPLPAIFGVNDLVLQAMIPAGLGTMSTQSASAVNITGGTITGITDLAIADGGSGASTGAGALTNFGVKRGTTAAYAGGGTSNAFTATGLAATDIVVSTILASTNSVSITKAVPTLDTLTVTFSSDPGAGTTVQWHALPA